MLIDTLVHSINPFFFFFLNNTIKKIAIMHRNDDAPYTRQRSPMLRIEWSFIAHSNPLIAVALSFGLSIMTSRRVRRVCIIQIAECNAHESRVLVPLCGQWLTRRGTRLFLFAAASCKRATDVCISNADATARNSVRDTFAREIRFFMMDVTMLDSLADFSTRLVASLTCSRRSAQDTWRSANCLFLFLSWSLPSSP